ncbi:Mms1p Ecym_7210 [Eremothecium cymbalariae DBVPG|uniref:Cleavage/polyadenylation specificity factor A subunit N-terminal domain-containing protein n=1 Tax=Eremothecium cymbalariae (strain CBS 270.75 / DBVPG 7215 / KCTC 17166 / NRRL Y-17582) TaxID=931890 RepID=G8JW42_ERECY|nr:hypothetical protein Ecym_7210 [Eremothecium cymbalariae DBVPG\
MEDYELFNVNPVRSPPLTLSESFSVHNYQFNEQFMLGAAAQKKLLPIRINTSKGKLTILNQLADRSVINKTYAPKEKVASNKKDTLDDPDIDILFSDAESEGSLPTIPTDGKVVLDTIVILHSSIELSGTAKYHHWHTKITDCKTIRHDEPKFIDDTILITTADNMLFSIVFNEKLEPRIVHWWILTSQKRAGSWEIILHPDRKHFLLYDREHGVIKFFGLQHECPYYFDLTRNMNLINTIISCCSYFISKTEVLLFITGIRSSRVFYCVLTWPMSSEEKPEVHQFAVPDGKLVQNVIPFNNNYCLCVKTNSVDVLSAHQLLISDGHGSSVCERSVLSDITHFEHDELLLEKLKSLDYEKYHRYTRSILFSTTHSSICVILADDQGAAQFYGLTRFKGLRGFTLLSVQDTDPANYKLQIISFDKVFEIILNISDLKCLVQDSDIESMSNVLARYTKDASFANADQLISFSAKMPITHEHNGIELWSCGPSSLSSISTNGYVEHYRSILKISQFQFFSRLFVLPIATLPGSLRLKMSMDDQESDGYLVVASDSNTVSKAFLLYFNTVENIECDEVEDILSFHNVPTVHYSVTEEFFVQITTEKMCLQSFKNEADTWGYNLPYKADGATSSGSQVLIWSGSNLIYFQDINLRDKSLKVGSVGNATIVHRIEKAFFNEEGSEIYLIINHKILVCAIDVKAEEINVLRDVELGSLLFDAVLVGYNEIICSTIPGAANAGVSSICKPFDITAGFNNLTGYYNIEYLGHGTCMFYNPHSIFLYDLFRRERIPVKLADWKRNNKIIAIKRLADRFAILFGDGLRVYENAYRSFTTSNIVLSSTSCTKKFLYLDKISRLLVANCNKKTLECIKLENGRRSILYTGRIFSDVDLLLDVQELILDELHRPNLQINNKDHIILACSCKRKLVDSRGGKNVIKILLIVPNPGRLVITHLVSLELESIGCNGKIKSVSDCSFWVSIEDSIAKYQLVRTPNGSKDPFTVERKYSWEVSSTKSFDADDFMVANVTVDGQISILTFQTNTTYIQDNQENTRKHTSVYITKDGSVIAYVEPLNHSNNLVTGALVLYLPRENGFRQLIADAKILLKKIVKSLHITSKNDIYLLNVDGTITAFKITKSHNIHNADLILADDDSSTYEFSGPPNIHLLTRSTTSITNNIGMWDLSFTPTD